MVIVFYEYALLDPSCSLLLSHARSHLTQLVRYVHRPVVRSPHLLVEMALRNLQILLPSAPRSAHSSNLESVGETYMRRRRVRHLRPIISLVSSNPGGSVTNINQNRGILQFPVLQARQVLSVVRATLDACTYYRKT